MSLYCQFYGWSRVLYEKLTAWHELKEIRHILRKSIILYIVHDIQ